MDELSLRTAFENRKVTLEAWGNEVSNRVTNELRASLGSDKPIEYFLKIWPVWPRVKGTNSFVRKALYRGKRYSNPLEEITDQVGVRFVTLLLSEIERVESVVLSTQIWMPEKARDFEDEKKADPLSFDYQSLHYVVRAAEAHEFGGALVAMGTACEIQIRTLLQHAYSELSHDAFYKPTMPGVAENPVLRREVARSMALIETTDLIFSGVMKSISDFTDELRRPVRDAAAVYRENIGPAEPTDFQMSDFVLASYRQYLPSVTRESLSDFLARKTYMKGFIRQKAEASAFFAQPLSLIISMLIEQDGEEIASEWPLEPDMLTLIYVQLGMADPD